MICGRQNRIGFLRLRIWNSDDRIHGFRSDAASARGRCDCRNGDDLVVGGEIVVASQKTQVMEAIETILLPETLLINWMKARREVQVCLLRGEGVPMLDHVDA